MISRIESEAVRFITASGSIPYDRSIFQYVLSLDLSKRGKYFLQRSHDFVNVYVNYISGLESLEHFQGHRLEVLDENMLFPSKNLVVLMGQCADKLIGHTVSFKDLACEMHFITRLAKESVPIAKFCRYALGYWFCGAYRDWNYMHNGTLHSEQDQRSCYDYLLSFDIDHLNDRNGDVVFGRAILCLVVMCAANDLGIDAFDYDSFVEYIIPGKSINHLLQTRLSLILD